MVTPDWVRVGKLDRELGTGNETNNGLQDIFILQKNISKSNFHPMTMSGVLITICGKLPLCVQIPLSAHNNASPRVINMKRA